MISIIIPVFNVEKYLEQCLESVLNQSYTNFECILIDDGSTDNSSNICDNWGKKDNRFKVIHQENKGVSAARNKGIEIANGEYLYFIDGDDICNTDIFCNIKKHDLYLGEYEIINNNDIILRKHTIEHEPKNLALCFLKEEIKACIGSFVVKKSILNENSIIFNNRYKYGEDLEFILKIILLSKSILIENKSYVKYIQHNNSAMYQFSLQRFDVFFSRLDLVSYVKTKDNPQVVDYLYNYSLVESIVEVVNILVVKKAQLKVIKSFFCKNPIFFKILKNNKVSKYKYQSKILAHNIYLYAMYIRLKSYLNILLYKLKKLH